MEPLTYAPPGSACGCVWPIQVRLRLSVDLYTFFPLVSELASEIAAGVSLHQSQVRIMGANEASQPLGETIVLINLLPSRESFDESTALLIYKKFWDKQVLIKTSLFGAYDVVYVRYPGLPPSPPMVPSTIDDQPYPGHDNDGGAIKPLGVNVPSKRKNRPHGGMIAVTVLSSLAAFVVCMGVIWLFLLKFGGVHQREQTPHVSISSHEKPSGTVGSLTFVGRPSSASLSLRYMGTAKIFSLNDIERATNNFNASKILGEGGFGLVYGGILDNGRKVAVKVLKRVDLQGTREFLAEVEMLSRLHHRNLVQLIGICTEDHTRCLVYELVPNGSVESHLHGRKPVDLTRPPGQENLVSWARPNLTTNDGLETIIDPALKPNIPFDSLTKVAAIASMCVQAEVSHRPSMGEVVQALKFICNEFDEIKEPISRSCSLDDLSVDVDTKISRVSGSLSASGFVGASAGFEGEEFGSFRRHSNSAPLPMGRGRQFSQGLRRGLSIGSMSE
ncbi:hypothetical protein U1Q18_026889 [Sarracenia purpurea var. burkii]